MRPGQGAQQGECLETEATARQQPVPLRQQGDEAPVFQGCIWECPVKVISRQPDVLCVVPQARGPHCYGETTESYVLATELFLWAQPSSGACCWALCTLPCQRVTLHTPLYKAGSGHKAFRDSLHLPNLSSCICTAEGMAFLFPG